MKNRKRILKNALSNDPCVRRELAEKLAGNSSEEAQIILKFLSHDKNALVRAEAYDSLSFCSGRKLEKVLKESIKQEKNKIARNYAIIAWFDVMRKQSGKKKKELAYIKKQRKKEKAECCLMTWSYCYYALSGKKLGQFLRFLNSKDYHVQCAALHMIYYETIHKKDRKKIMDKIEEIRNKTAVRAVKTTAEQVLAEC